MSLLSLVGPASVTKERPPRGRSWARVAERGQARAPWPSRLAAGLLLATAVSDALGFAGASFYLLVLGVPVTAAAGLVCFGRVVDAVNGGRRDLLGRLQAAPRRPPRRRRRGRRRDARAGRPRGRVPPRGDGAPSLRVRPPPRPGADRARSPSGASARRTKARTGRSLSLDRDLAEVLDLRVPRRGPSRVASPITTSPARAWPSRRRSHVDACPRSARTAAAPRACTRPTMRLARVDSRRGSGASPDGGPRRAGRVPGSARPARAARSSWPAPAEDGQDGVARSCPPSRPRAPREPGITVPKYSFSIARTSASDRSLRERA